jgi:hypothetical protein
MLKSFKIDGNSSIGVLCKRFVHPLCTEEFMDVLENPGMKALRELMTSWVILSFVVGAVIYTRPAKAAEKQKRNASQEMEERIKWCMKINRNEKLCNSIPEILKNLEDSKKTAK